MHGQDDEDEEEQISSSDNDECNISTVKLDARKRS